MVSLDIDLDTSPFELKQFTSLALNIDGEQTPISSLFSSIPF